MKGNYVNKLTVCITASLLLNCLTASSKIIYLDGWNTTSGDGTTWTKAFTSWTDAMAAAESGDDIYVAGGAYSQANVMVPQEYKPEKDKFFAWKDGVDIFGGWDPISNERNPQVYTTVLKANGNRIFFTNPFTTDSYLDGFTLTGANKTATNGNAVYMRAGAHITNCHITGNSGTANGCINLESKVTNNPDRLVATVENCLFENNTAKIGGALYISYGGEVKNCIFYNNEAVSSSGGALAVNGGNVYEAAGLPETPDPLPARVINCLFSNNYANGNGGAVWSQAGEFINCTFVNNKTFREDAVNVGNGGGVLLDDREVILKGKEVKVPTILRNCVVWGNTTAKYENKGKDCAFSAQIHPGKEDVEVGVLINTAVQNIEDVASVTVYADDKVTVLHTDTWITSEKNPTCFGLSESNNADNGPKFTLPTSVKGLITDYNGDYTLQEGSILVNKGDNSFIDEAKDLAGNTRKIGVVDLGAYEQVLGNGLRQHTYNNELTCMQRHENLVFSAINDKVYIYNLSGTLVLSSENCKCLNISQLPQGMYCVKMVCGHQENTQKFIK